MSKQITIRFEKDSNEEFVGLDWVEKYESAISSSVEEAFPDAEVVLLHDSSWKTQIESSGFDEDGEDEVRLGVESIIIRIGNNLAAYCS